MTANILTQHTLELVNERFLGLFKNSVYRVAI